MMKKLSVIIPLYNNEKYIKQCLESICGQTLSEIDIIVVDDGSTDKSGLIADEFSKSDERITVIHQTNKGLAEARYSGLKVCKTEYATFVDSDDFVLKDSFERAVEFMNQGVDMIFFEISRYFNDMHVKRECHTLSPGFYDNNRIKNEVLSKLIWNFKENCRGLEPSQCVRITKKDYLIKRYGEFTERVFYGEDTLMTYPLYLSIRNMVVVPYSYYMHRQYSVERPYINADNFFDEVYCLYKQLNIAFKNHFTLEYDFQKQIDFLYMFLIQEKKDHRDPYSLRDKFLFPFNKTMPSKNIILYGAGNMGHVYYNQLEKIKYCNDVLWVDKNFAYYEDKRIKNIDEIKGYAADYVVIAIENKEIYNEVVKYLRTFGIEEGKII